MTATTERLLAMLLILLIGGCTQPEQSAPDPAAAARQAIDHAQGRYRDSQAAGHAWSQTSVRLEAARQALQAEDFATAAAQAERALALAEASLAQARAEQDAWRERFPELPATAE